jgi:hypothetical protein
LKVVCDDLLQGRREERKGERKGKKGVNRKEEAIKEDLNK